MKLQSTFASPRDLERRRSQRLALDPAKRFLDPGWRMRWLLVQAGMTRRAPVDRGAPAIGAGGRHAGARWIARSSSTKSAASP